MASDLSNPSTAATCDLLIPTILLLELPTYTTDYLLTMNSIHRDSLVDIISEVNVRKRQIPERINAVKVGKRNRVL